MQDEGCMIMETIEFEVTPEDIEASASNLESMLLGFRQGYEDIFKIIDDLHIKYQDSTNEDIVQQENDYITQIAYNPVTIYDKAISFIKATQTFLMTYMKIENEVKIVTHKMKGTTIEVQYKKINFIQMKIEKFSIDVDGYSRSITHMIETYGRKQREQECACYFPFKNNETESEHEKSAHYDLYKLITDLYANHKEHYANFYQEINEFKKYCIDADEALQYFIKFLRSYGSNLKCMAPNPHGISSSSNHRNSYISSTDSSNNDNNKCTQNNISLDQVSFSAIVPKALSKDEYEIINLIVYEKEYRSVVNTIIETSDEPVKEVISRTMNMEQHAAVRVVIDAVDIEIDDNIEECRWDGGYINFSFSILVPANYIKKKVLFNVAVYVNDIIATRLKFTADVSPQKNENHGYRHELNISREDVLSAFMSYASQDRNRVAMMIQGMKKARPDMDIFFDVENLRSGEDWENALKREIENRDILFLCWSRFARESKWVEAEWKYALQNKGINSIEPIPIESPDVCPPPTELQNKHFNDKMLYIINYNVNMLNYIHADDESNISNRTNKGRTHRLRDMI